jgi:hypothetical protein
VVFVQLGDFEQDLRERGLFVSLFSHRGPRRRSQTSEARSYLAESVPPTFMWPESISWFGREGTLLPIVSLLAA